MEKQINKLKLNGQQIGLFEWVKQQHGSQVRKYTGEPYWTHLERVAEILYNRAYGDLIEIALCHDLLEDTTCTERELCSQLLLLQYDIYEVGFIGRGVLALTDQYTHESYPEMNRIKRKLWETVRLKSIRPEYQTVKYADLIDNTSSILQHDEGFSKIYLEEKKRLLEVMNEGCPELYELSKMNINF